MKLRSAYPAQQSAIASAEELLAKDDSELGIQVLTLFNGVSLPGPEKSERLGRMVRLAGREALADYLVLFTKRGRR